MRPDCDHPGGAEDTDEYFVERIIGRRPISRQDASSTKKPNGFMWLVKWDGCVLSRLLRRWPSTEADLGWTKCGASFKADQATWGAKDDFDDCSRMIEEFEFAAQIEGRKLAERNKTILLNEAAAAGWAAFRF